VRTRNRGDRKGGKRIGQIAGKWKKKRLNLGGIRMSLPSGNVVLTMRNCRTKFQWNFRKKGKRKKELEEGSVGDPENVSQNLLQRQKNLRK